jgi:hypothetical protein
MSTSKPSELTTEKGKSSHCVTLLSRYHLPSLNPPHTAQPKTKKAASKSTHTSINTGNKWKCANSAPPSPEHPLKRPKPCKAQKSNSSRKIIPESDGEDEEDDEDDEEDDSDDEEDDDGSSNGLDKEIEAAYAKLQADQVAEGQGKVCLLSNVSFLSLILKLFA